MTSFAMGGGGGKSRVTRFLYWHRTAHVTKHSLIRKVACKVLAYYQERYGLEIPYQCKIGGGLYIGHAFNITINPGAAIGNNCNIHKGVLIGQTNRGNKGVPCIGSNVWIGINAAIVGNVKIGDDVLIAPNTFVNCDVPSHSVVFGNP